jgi:hypothetical protein
MATPMLVVPALAGEPPPELRPPWTETSPPVVDAEPPVDEAEPPDVVAPPPSPCDEVTTPPQAESASTTHPISHRSCTELA